MDTSPNIFNWPALAAGCSALIICLAIQGVVVVLLLLKLKPRMRRLSAQKRHVAAHAFFCIAILSLLMAHLTQMYIWGLFLYVPGIMTNVHTAMLFAGSTYTTVGFTNDTLPTQWQLLAVIMATTGLFAFSWSTSAMFSLSQPLYQAES